jgi:hypothetical protein
VPITNPTFTGGGIGITSVSFSVNFGVEAGGQSDANGNFYIDDGGGFCVGHPYSGHAANACNFSTWLANIQCTHHTWNEGVLDGEDLVIRFEATSYGETDTNIYVDAVRMVVVYTCTATIGTPGAPSLSTPASGTIRITKPSNPSGSPNQWQARQTNDSWSSSWVSTGTSTVDNTGLDPIEYTYDVRFRQTSPCVGTGSYGSDASETAWVLVEQEYTRPSDTLIIVVTDNTEASDTAIQIPDNLVLIEGEIYEPPSDTDIQVLDNLVLIEGEVYEPPSDTDIQVLDNLVLIEGEIYEPPSDTDIQVLDNLILIEGEIFEPPSDHRIWRTGDYAMETTIDESFARILRSQFADIQKDSEIAIFRGAYADHTQLSETRLLLTSTPRTIPLDSMEAYYPLDRNSLDYSGNGYHGTISEGMEYEAAEKHNGVRTTEGDTYLEYIEIADDDALNVYTGGFLSYSLFVEIDSSVSEIAGDIISKPWNSSGRYNYRLIVGENHDLLLALQTNDYNVSQNSANDVWVDDTRFHVALTFNGTTKFAKVYVNTVEVISLDFSSIISWVPSVGDSDRPLCIGTTYPYGNDASPIGREIHMVNGVYDELVIYSKTLSEAEIITLANATAVVSQTTIETITDVPHTSDTRIKRLTGGIIGKLSRTLILGRYETSELSSTAVFRGAYADLQLTSGVSIVQFQAFDKPSDTIILKATDVPVASDTFIIYRFDPSQSSDTLILSVTDIPPLSDTRILKTTEMTAAADTRILDTSELSPLSSTRIKSSVFIQIWYRSDTTISNRITIDQLSIAAIKRTSFADVTVTSSTEIVRVTDLQFLSSTAIQHQQETSERSQTTISVRTDSTKLSGTSILLRTETSTLSSTRIITIVGRETTMLSGTRIRIPDKDTVDYLSSTTISVMSKLTTTSGTKIRGRLGEFPS